MYFFTCLMMAASSGLIFKACLFHQQYQRWPLSTQELLQWPMRLSSKLIIGFWTAIWLLAGLSKPLASLSGTGFIICLIASLPVGAFILLWLAELRKK